MFAQCETHRRARKGKSLKSDARDSATKWGPLPAGTTERACNNGETVRLPATHGPALNSEEEPLTIHSLSMTMDGPQTNARAGISHDFSRGRNSIGIDNGSLKFGAGCPGSCWVLSQGVRGLLTPFLILRSSAQILDG